MKISSIPDISIDTTSVLQKENETASSLDSYFLDASANSRNSVSGDTAGDDAVQEFMRPARQTPAQPMFDSWLQSQNITEQRYNAMTPAEKQKRIDHFKAQIKKKLCVERTGLPGASVTLQGPASPAPPAGGHQPRVWRRSFSSMVAAARPFMVPVTCSLTSARILGSL